MIFKLLVTSTKATGWELNEISSKISEGRARIPSAFNCCAFKAGKQ